MPIALDPAQTVPFWLASDADMPEKLRPTFTLGYMTCRQTLRYEQLVNSAAESRTQDERIRDLNKALAIMVRGWKNLNDLEGNPLEYKRGGEAGDELPALSEALTVEEKWEFALEGRRKIRLSESDKKKSRSQPGTDTEKSAPAAETNASTNPQ